VPKILLDSAKRIILLQLKVGLAEEKQQSETSWDGHELFSLTDCIINRGPICSCQLYVMKKWGEGAEKGIQKPASCPWNVSLGMLNASRAVICQGLSSGAE